MVESRGKLKSLFTNRTTWVRVVDIALGMVALVSALGFIAILMFMED